jgi:hypothetical protein
MAGPCYCAPRHPNIANLSLFANIGRWLWLFGCVARHTAIPGTRYACGVGSVDIIRTVRTSNTYREYIFILHTEMSE